MNLKYIYTNRKYEQRAFFDLVYEWEDILIKVLDLTPYHYNEEWSSFGGYYCLRHRYLRRLIKRFQVIRNCFIPQDAGLKLDMWTHLARRFNGEHILPWIIDFFIEEKDLGSFNESYKYYPLVLISSKEVYEILQANKDIVKDVNFRHVGLSISDKYRISKDSKYKKEYDVVLIGRQNPVMGYFFKQYVAKHPNIRYAYRKLCGVDFGNENYYQYYAYSNGVETFIGDIREREHYIDLMKKSRIGLYATPDIDTDHERAHGYNQVTPRFLEWIACGAHVIARYVPNPDTEYYRLQDFSAPIETYEQFEKAMDYAMNHDVNMERYADYLTQHYTSVRAKQISEIIKEQCNE